MKELISLNGDGNKVRFMRGEDGDIVIAFDIPEKNLFNESVRIGIGNSGGQNVPHFIKKGLICLCDLMRRWEEIELEAGIVFLESEPLPKELIEHFRVLQEEMLERMVVPSYEETARLTAIETNLKEREARDRRQQHKLALKFSNKKK